MEVKMTNHEMRKQAKENRLIEEYATRWNKKFKNYAGGWVGKANVERMLFYFLKAYKKEVVID